MEFFQKDDFPKKIYTKDYISNGIRVMKKYLLPSLENQRCKKFIWLLILGDKSNITYIKSLMNFNLSFEMDIIYIKNFKDYLKKKSQGFDVLITSRIDYDDRIYYDAVNDVRKAININKPMFIYGYNRGVYYFEEDDKYYEFYSNYNNEGCMSVFISLIIVLNKVNGTYNIYEIGNHDILRKRLIESYKKYGMNELGYDPAFFDNGDAKFVYVRQKYSTIYNHHKNMQKRMKEYDFNLNKFYDK